MRPGGLKPLPARILHLRSRSRSLPATYYTNFFSPSRHLANVRPDNDIFLNVAFNPAHRSRQEPQLGQPVDAPPPGERTLKLGKSECIVRVRLLMLTSSSAARLAVSIAQPSRFSTAAGDPESTYFVTLIPIHTSSSAYCLWSRRLPCRTMDFSNHMGQDSTHWQRESRDFIRAHGKERRAATACIINIDIPSKVKQRKAHRALANVWEDYGSRHRC